MVTRIHFIVNFAIVRFKLIGAQNVVDAEEISFLIIRQTKPATCLHETVFKTFGDGAADIGYGVVIEVAAYDDGVLAMGFDIGMDGISLFRAFGCISA